VARLTRTQSDFGVQMDSLADVRSFGVVPALVAWHWGLSNYGQLGLAACFVFTACGAIRLARFNVLAARSPGGPSNFFVGLPIPAAAGLLVSTIIASLDAGAPPPDGVSSTVRCLPRPNVLMSTASSSHIPCRNALPTIETPRTPGKASGKSVRQVARKLMASR
jgi:CDP-diacylglycerol--serine O-phosphatidyltransferase